MLVLKNISKNYEIGKKKDKSYQIVHALKEINLEFRKNEFVSILGPSGCGKTTMLNIIGGLDKYTSGDLIINNKSTKKYKDSDWDTYRNHSIGFVFQSYNLIPHQTILQNVELALTLSGVSKEERKKRAIKVLEKVGLKDRINTKPNQLSGGQMQRVAIARALVNDPEIILADEPTGALDSKTSVQIMELLKEISKDKLIIMVTHNPELADKYSSRIIKLLDGSIIDDSNPYDSSKNKIKDDVVLSVANDKDLSKKDIIKKGKKKRMSFFTALALSFKNLLTKKARTFLVSFAGSIGIIGIALILSVSSGFQTYINKIQEDSLSSYPITIEESTFNPMTMLSSIFSSNDKKANHSNDEVYASEAITTLFSTVADAAKPNDIKSFYSYLQGHYGEIKNNVNAIQYTYNLNLELYNQRNEKILPKSKALFNVILAYSTIYFENLANVEIVQVGENYEIQGRGTTAEEKTKTYGFIKTYINEESMNKFIADGDKLTITNGELIDIIDNIIFKKSSSSMGAMSSYSIRMFYEYDLGAVYEMIDNEELIKSQYDIVAGNWVQNEDDVLLVLDSNNEIDDYVLYSLGMLSYEEMMTSIKKTVTNQENSVSVKYEDIVNSTSEIKYKLILPTSYYNETTASVDRGTISEADYVEKLKQVYSSDELVNFINSHSKEIKISGIIRPKKNVTNACLKSGLAYSKKLTDLLITEYNSSQAVRDGKIKIIDKSNPSSIAIYVATFDDKKVINNFIDTYNNSREDESKAITYNNTIDVLMSSITTIINSISYVLIAFVSISLVVSSIMIGIITYISVIERTKEIGVLRSIGASKRDVKRVFTAESLIIGFTAGVFGIILTLILCIPINIIVNALAGIASVAQLPVLGAVILVAISMGLTFIAGLIPARIASKKDPVVALRTE